MGKELGATRDPTPEKNRLSDITAAIMNELDGRSLFNGVDDETQNDICVSIYKLIEDGLK